MDYEPKNVSISFAVGSYAPGDYVRLHGNSGSGSVDWTNPVDNKKTELFQNDSGYFGWGHIRWGHFRWGHGDARNVAGWGHLPWGNFAWGRGAAIVLVHQQIIDPGYWRFGFSAYDSAGNVHSGTPGETEEYVSLTPQQPSVLKKNNYHNGRSQMTFTV